MNLFYRHRGRRLAVIAGLTRNLLNASAILLAQEMAFRFRGMTVPPP